jgi:hypothetical protein
MKIVPWVLVLSLAAVCGCAATESAEDREEAEYFRSELAASLGKVDTFLGPVSEDRDISEMGLGMFALSVINQMCSQDDELFRYVHADNRDTEGYLRGPFQADPDGEVKVIAAMAARGNATHRLPVMHVLDAVGNLPTAKAAPDFRQRLRKKLAASLTRLKAALRTALAEASPPPRYYGGL